jgi:hypothetical protein
VETRERITAAMLRKPRIREAAVESRQAWTPMVQRRRDVAVHLAEHEPTVSNPGFVAPQLGLHAPRR